MPPAASCARLEACSTSPRPGRDRKPVRDGAGERAAEIIDDLAEDRSSALTHGDLSFANVRRRAEDDWVAIDPGWLCGPVEHEAHTVVRSVLPGVLDAPRPREGLRALAGAFCETSGADLERAETLSSARFVASYFWEAQHAGTADDIERLRRAIELLMEDPG